MSCERDDCGGRRIMEGFGEKNERGKWWKDMDV